MKEYDPQEDEYYDNRDGACCCYGLVVMSILAWVGVIAAIAYAVQHFTGGH